jgi:hypothetical protein
LWLKNKAEINLLKIFIASKLRRLQIWNLGWISY